MSCQYLARACYWAVPEDDDLYWRDSSAESGRQFFTTTASWPTLETSTLCEMRQVATDFTLYGDHRATTQDR